jgi:hypothetical protein
MLTHELYCGIVYNHKNTCKGLEKYRDAYRKLKAKEKKKEKKDA